MTDTHHDDHPDLDLRAEIARIDRDRAETQKLFAEQDKLFAEQRKLVAESLKLRGDARWQPILVLSGVGAAVLTSFAALLTALLKHG
jgi:hypothetical protein